MYIFDLDRTVINSDHRRSVKQDGSLDLEFWQENNTPEKIAQDTLLPLARFWQSKIGEKVIAVSTARVMQDADYQFLADNGLKYHFLLSRNSGDTSSDVSLKYWHFQYLRKQTKLRFEFMQLFEDQQAILRLGERLGMIVFDSIAWNRKIARAA